MLHQIVFALTLAINLLIISKKKMVLLINYVNPYIYE